MYTRRVYNLGQWRDFSFKKMIFINIYVNFYTFLKMENKPNSHIDIIYICSYYVCSL